MFKQFEFKGQLRDACLSKVEQSAETMEKLYAWKKKARGIFFFSGNVGNGKSYCASAMYNALKEENKNIRVYNEAFLSEELKMCINIPAWSPEHRIDCICESQYFILDDLGSTFSMDKERNQWVKDMLYKIVDYRYESHLPTFITSNLTKKNLDEYFHIRMSSRIYDINNIIVELDEPDRRQDEKYMK